MSINKFNSWLKSSIRLVLTVIVCGVFFAVSVNPAQAVTSKSTDGVANLNEIQRKTDNVADSAPRGIKEITKEAQKGTNAVQGGADADKMISPSDTNATTAKEKAASFLNNLGN